MTSTHQQHSERIPPHAAKAAPGLPRKVQRANPNPVTTAPLKRASATCCGPDRSPYRLLAFATFASISCSSQRPLNATSKRSAACSRVRTAASRLGCGALPRPLTHAITHETSANKKAVSPMIRAGLSDLARKITTATPETTGYVCGRQTGKMFALVVRWSPNRGRLLRRCGCRYGHPGGRGHACQLRLL
jgi:hypothetical protein